MTKANVSRAVLLTAALMCVSASAHAEDVVGVLEVSTDGLAPEAIVKFSESFADGVRNVGFTVVPESRLADRLAHTSYMQGCHFGPCLRVIKKRLKLDRVVIMQVRVAGSSYGMVASLVDTESGALLHQVSRDCVACSVGDAISTAFNVGVELMSLATGKIDNNQSTRVAVRGPVLVAESRRKKLKATAWVMMGSAVLAGAAGAYLLSQDDDVAGMSCLVGGGVAAVSGVTMLAFAREF